MGSCVAEETSALLNVHRPTRTAILMPDGRQAVRVVVSGARPERIVDHYQQYSLLRSRSSPAGHAAHLERPIILRRAATGDFKSYKFHFLIDSHVYFISGIKCPVCSKFVLPDDIECHLVMCLTKPRLNYNGILSFILLKKAET